MKTCKKCAGIVLEKNEELLSGSLDFCNCHEDMQDSLSCAWEEIWEMEEKIEKQEDRIKEQQVQINELKNDRIDDIQRNCDPLT